MSRIWWVKQPLEPWTFVEETPRGVTVETTEKAIYKKLYTSADSITPTHRKGTRKAERVTFVFVSLPQDRRKLFTSLCRKCFRKREYLMKASLKPILPPSEEPTNPLSQGYQIPEYMENPKSPPYWLADFHKKRLEEAGVLSDLEPRAWTRTALKLLEQYEYEDLVACVEYYASADSPLHGRFWTLRRLFTLMPEFQKLRTL